MDNHLASYRVTKAFATPHGPLLITTIMRDHKDPSLRETVFSERIGVEISADDWLTPTMVEEILAYMRNPASAKPPDWIGDQIPIPAAVEPFKLRMASEIDFLDGEDR